MHGPVNAKFTNLWLVQCHELATNITTLSLLVLNQLTRQAIDCGTLPDYLSVVVVLHKNTLEPSSFAETYRYAGQKCVNFF